MRAAVQVEARVLALLAHRPHVAHAGGGDQQPHSRVAHPERGQPAELLGEVEAEVGAADHRVDPLGPHQVLRAEHLGGVGGEGRAEGVEALRLQRKSRRGAVPAERGQVLRAGLERRRAGRSRGCCGPSRALPPRRRARSRSPAGGGARPGGRRRSRSRPGASPRRRRPAPAPRAARPGSARRALSAAPSTSRSVARRSPLARLSSFAISAARPGSSVRKSSTPASARYRRPAALIRGASRNARSPSSSRVGLTFRRLDQRPDPRPLQRAAPRSSPLLTSDRFSPTSGTTSATVASATRSRSLSCAVRGKDRGGPDGASPRCSGGPPRSSRNAHANFQATAGPAQLLERVAVDLRVQDRAVGQLLGPLVVVGDDRRRCPATSPARPPPRRSSRSRP